MVLPGQRRRREGNQAHGDRINKGGHHVGHIHGDAVLTVQHGGGLFGKAQTVLQAAHDDLGVDDVDDAHGGVAQRDGDADEQDLLDDLAAGGGNVQRLLPVLMGSQIGKEEQHGDGRACCDADNGPGGAQLGSQADVQHIPCQRQANAQLQQGFQHLTDGGGGHVALSLGVAPHTGQQAHAEHGRSQRLHGGGGQR